MNDQPDAIEALRYVGDRKCPSCGGGTAEFHLSPTWQQLECRCLVDDTQYAVDVHWPEWMRHV
jgi:hypothetical protein